jgi:hypothetical protein
MAAVLRQKACEARALRFLFLFQLYTKLRRDQLLE